MGVIYNQLGPFFTPASEIYYCIPRGLGKALMGNLNSYSPNLGDNPSLENTILDVGGQSLLRKSSSEPETVA